MASLSPERYQQVKLIFQEVLERPAPDRAAYLASRCGKDAGLRQEVERLLRSDQESGGFLAGPAVASVSRFFEDRKLESLVGKRIGPYEALSEIGRGGMGTVYLASRADAQYHKLVAIKVVNAGPQSESMIRRFRRERQILANLEHPNIAQLLDGGTTDDGRPYLVMEYVGGVPVDEYCATRKLTLEARLDLFRTVCGAVHHAHQNLVVHRDLKPANMLVKSDGAIKLLDFGIAKLLSPDQETHTLERTSTSMRILTPEYASPEQLKGDPITTATDIFLLGLVLYELTTGKRPPRTSTGTLGEWGGAALPADLAAIIEKALQPAPSNRYGTVEKLAEDVHRYQRGLPVQARGDAPGYRLGRFIARHKAAAAGVLAILLLFLGGLGVAAWQVREAKQQVEVLKQELEQTRRQMGK